MLDAYRVLTGQDDLVRKNIMKMQRDFAQVNARWHHDKRLIKDRFMWLKLLF